MANNIEYRKAYTAILDEVYQRASVSGCLTSGSRMVRQGAIQFSYESHSPDYDRGLKLVADVMDVEEAGLIDCFVAAGSELQRTQVAPEGDAYTFAKIAGFEGVTTKSEDLSDASAESLLASLREVTSAMDTDNDIAPCGAFGYRAYKTLREWRPAPMTTQRMDCRQVA